MGGNADPNWNAGDVYQDPGFTASDSFEGDLAGSVVVSGDTVDASTPGIYTVLYNVSDSSENAAVQVARTVSVSDVNEIPVITLVGDSPYVLEASNAVSYSDPGATASDPEDGDISGSVQVSGQVVNLSVPGSYLINYDVQDSAGNDAETVTRTVTVQDTLAPVITLQGTSPFYVEAGTLFQDPGVVASDSFEGDLTTSVVVGGDAVDANTLGEYTVRYDVQDSSSNSATQVLREVTVRDTLAPVITLLGESVIQLDAGDVYQDPGVTASDSFEGDLAGSVVVSGDAVDASIPGTYTVLYNVSDSSENAAVQVARTVSVSDVNEIPVITLVGDSPYVLEASNAVSYSDPGATASDAEDGDISGLVQVSGQVVNLSVPGSYLIEYDVTDSAGNDAETVTRTVLVQDTLAPVITLTGDASVTVQASLTGSYVDAGATANDSLDGDLTGSVVVGGDLIDLSQPGTYTLTYNVSDSAGNDAEQVTRTVNVVAVGTSTVSIASTQQGSEADNSATIFTLTRTGDTAGELTVNLVLQGTALPNEDYTAPAGLGTNNTLSVTFAAGSATVAVSLPTLSDSVVDPYESVNAILLEDFAYSLSPNSHKATAVITAESVVVAQSGTSTVGFTDAGPQKQTGQWRNYGAFAVIRDNGTVASWGNDITGGQDDTKTDQLTDVKQIFSGYSAFAALHHDGAISTWGRDGRGGDVTPPGDGWESIYSNKRAFSAIHFDGTVFAWGDSDWGGDASTSIVSSQLTDVASIQSTARAFAALRQDGSVVAWGDVNYGGSSINNLTGVEKLFSNEAAFAAIKADGSIECWGSATAGGDHSPPGNDFINVYSNRRAFAALRADGSVYTWGGAAGDSSLVADQLTEVIDIFSTESGFAALRADRTVVTWGDDGGDSSGVSDQLVGVTQLIGTSSAFAALREDGSIITWGDTSRGGVDGPIDAGYLQIYSNEWAFTAIKADGSLFSWGADGEINAATPSGGGHGAVFSTKFAFASLKTDGSVVAWGAGGPGSDNSNYGEDGAKAGNNFVAFAEPNVNDVLGQNSPPVFVDQTFSVAENSEDSTVVGTLAAIDADGDPLTYSIASNVDPDGDGNAAFRIEGDQLLVNDADDFDYEANSQPVITAEASDGSLSDTAQITVNVSDVNEAPTDVALANEVASIPENTITTSVIKLADIVIADDALGSNAISLSGTDAASFEVVGTELFLAAGTTLDYETQSSYDVTVSVEDSGVAGSSAVTANYTLMIDDVVETVISGALYEDSNRNGTRDIDEAGISDLLVYIDLNQNARHDSDEPSLLSSTDDPATPSVDESGTYSFENFLAGEVFVSAALPEDGAMWVRSQPNVPFFADAVGYDGLIGDRGVASGDLNNDGYADLVGIGSGLSVVLIDDGGVCCRP